MTPEIERIKIRRRIRVFVAMLKLTHENELSNENARLAVENARLTIDLNKDVVCDLFNLLQSKPNNFLNQWCRQTVQQFPELKPIFAHSQ